MSKGLHSLTWLDLSANKLTNGGADQSAIVEFAANLPSANKLAGLNLANNMIDSTGAAALAEGLRLHPSLTHVNLGRNQVHDQGATVFGWCLALNGGQGLT